MDEFKSSQKKNDLKQFIKNNYADLIGSGISGTLSLFSAVDPFVGFLAGPAGVIVSGTLLESVLSESQMRKSVIDSNKTNPLTLALKNFLCYHLMNTNLSSRKAYCVYCY